MIRFDSIIILKGETFVMTDDTHIGNLTIHKGGRVVSLFDPNDTSVYPRKFKLYCDVLDLSKDEDGNKT